MNHRESMDESPDDNKKGFQYVDLKRNAVRGPDSQRGEMSASYQNPVRKASWSRSPTRPLRSNFEQLFTTTDGWKTDNRDTFKVDTPTIPTRHKQRFLRNCCRWKCDEALPEGLNHGVWSTEESRSIAPVFRTT